VPDDGKATHAVSDPFFCETIEATSEVASALGVPVGNKVVHVKRLLRFSGEPVVFDQIYLVAELFDG
jgi:GntR family transcriptional regulator